MLQKLHFPVPLGGAHFQQVNRFLFFHVLQNSYPIH